jgi:hypothetical protein
MAKSRSWNDEVGTLNAELKSGVVPVKTIEKPSLSHQRSSPAFCFQFIVQRFGSR